MQQAALLPDRRQIDRARIAVSAIFFLNGTGIGLWAAHIPPVRDRLDISESLLGLALLTLALGAMAAMPAMGWAITRTGSRRATIAAALAFICTLPLPIMVPGVPLLFIAALLFGASNGALDVAMNAHASEVERARGQPTMSSFHGFYSIGGLAGAALGGTLIAHDLSNGVGILAAALAGFIAIVMAAPLFL